MNVIDPIRQRDMDLVRLILLRSAGCDVAEELKQYTQQQRAFHVALLIDAGYIRGEVTRDPEGFPATSAIVHLTWQGFEFLELVKDGKLWKGARTVFTKTAGWSTPLLVEWLKAEAKKYLGLPPTP